MSTDEWTTLLDQLEADAERILAAEPGSPDAPEVLPWTAPSAPLPPHLADRARRVLDLQHSAMTRTRDDLDTLRQHLGAVRLVPGSRRPEEPAYLDVDG